MVAFCKNLWLNTHAKGFSYGNKTYLSTVENPSRTHAWFPRKNGDKGWPRCIEQPPRHRSQTFGRFGGKLKIARLGDFFIP